MGLIGNYEYEPISIEDINYSEEIIEVCDMEVISLANYILLKIDNKIKHHSNDEELNKILFEEYNNINKNILSRFELDKENYKKQIQLFADNFVQTISNLD